MCLYAPLIGDCDVTDRTLHNTMYVDNTLFQSIKMDIGRRYYARRWLAGYYPVFVFNSLVVFHI